MRRLSSTVVVVAGERADQVVSALGSLHNVRALTAGDRTAAEVTDALSATAGRWWPADLAGWLRALPKVVPDQAGIRP
ncbi:hypothetical protein [Actinomadura alba]|uniref:Uncharacterized protein n=1 Tax=Actinomadura alba TaxID=406431 RepID=A0ABR7LX31_9ACTN|nr:hypothetical protein [Actinomadura alba]MBC6469414.1 hypothetical protein [Actinomadura alba]